MKKFLPYILGLAAVALLLTLVLTQGGRQARLDERMTLRQNDQAPYGTYAARQLLPGLFPNSSISFDRKKPGHWDSVTQTSYNQAAILVCTEFYPDPEEIFRLMYFARMGNYVYLITRELSSDANDFFSSMSRAGLEDEEDSLKVTLEPPVYKSRMEFTYPGRKYEAHFTSVDPLRTVVLGRNLDGTPNFIRMNIGQGSFFINLVPAAFTNYFVLHGDNVRYYEQALSVIPPTVDKIVWNEYYLSRPRPEGQGGGKQKTPSPLRVLMEYPSFRWGLLTVLATILLYALMEVRRRQRMIPVYRRPQNDSLDFIRTIGRLYYDRRDHRNLARKMSSYFLEHVRITYKMPTHLVDGNFIETLHFKSGYPREGLEKIIGFIRHLESTEITEEQLSVFYGQLELFYQNT
jgi:hypothetical protein